MFLTKTEKLTLRVPGGTILITRSKLKAVIIEVSFNQGYNATSRTVVNRKDDTRMHHFAFGTLEQLKDYYGYSLLHEN